MSSNTDIQFSGIDLNKKEKTVEQWLAEVDYSDNPDYQPSAFALEMVNFIKMVEGGDPENKSPVVHYKIIDKYLPDNDLDTLNLCHRGIAKTTLKEYLILYLGVYGALPNFGKVPYAVFVSDSIENGVKKMRKSLEYRWTHSEFLQTYIPITKFTDVRWEFINQDGLSFVVAGYGAQTGIRGTRENNSRPVLALLDDLISDADARSPTVIAAVEDTVYRAVDLALHPQRRKIIWSGTPFNARDPLYKAVESGTWEVNVYPICEKFPCSREDFRGSWPDRFSYDYVLKQYTKAVKRGRLSDFNQELMLNIVSNEDRLVKEHCIKWYPRELVMANIGKFNIYITTDFATSDKKKADPVGISVWAYNNVGQWFWLDGILNRQLMDVTVDDLFRFCSMYNPSSVGIEVSGQQGGFIQWIQSEMIRLNIYFNLASSNNSKNPGILPTTDKFTRFYLMCPQFTLGMINFPEEMKDDQVLEDGIGQIRLATKDGFKAANDDFLDTISMLGVMDPWKPSEEAKIVRSADSVYFAHQVEEPESVLESYLT